MSTRNLTKGEYLVEITFNPGNNSTVENLKSLAAELIDQIQLIRSNSGNDAEVGRLKALAITNIEQGAMWAVKAATKPSYLTENI